MAKNFPYFKFTATEWLTGDIIFEDYELQGIFINLCALYWHRDGNITIQEIQKRLKTERILELKDRFISIDENENISIKFLDEQLFDAKHISKINSDNGKKGAEAKRNKATAKRPLSETQAEAKRNVSKEEEEKEKDKNKKENTGFVSEDELVNFINHIRMSDVTKQHFIEWYTYLLKRHNITFSADQIQKNVTYCGTFYKGNPNRFYKDVQKSIANNYKKIVAFEEHNDRPGDAYCEFNHPPFNPEKHGI
jgi:hypothetical protein